MRFAISVMATASGLCLLALAIYGQPDVYLRMAREQWDNLTQATRTGDVPPPAEPDFLDQTRAERDRAAADARLAQLQQEVARLQADVAASQSAARQAREALAEALAHPPAPVASAPAAPVASAPANPVPPAISPNTQETTVVPERRDTAIRPAPERREPPAPFAPPVRQQPREQASRQDPDDTRSVLARLRQTPPPPEPAAAPPNVQPPPAGPSPSLRRLIAARAALANGRIDEARRLLQEAQLQLVFRPVGSAGDNGAAAAHAAAEVARALEALSANDAAQSRAHIDRAVDDATGGAVLGPETAGGGGSTPAGSGSGYAPAYPPGYAPAYAR